MSCVVRVGGMTYLRFMIEVEPIRCQGSEAVEHFQPCLLQARWWEVENNIRFCDDHAFDAAVQECKRQFFGGTGVNEAEGEAASEGGTAGPGSDTRTYPGASTTTREEKGDA